MEKNGMNVEFMGLIYNPKALSKGTSFSIRFSKQDQNGEWYSAFVSCYTPSDAVLQAKDKVKFKGFVGVDAPWKDRPAGIKIIAMDIEVIDKAGQQQVMNHTDTPAASQSGAIDYGF